jgi:hypothetical protein
LTTVQAKLEQTTSYHGPNHGTGRQRRYSPIVCRLASTLRHPNTRRHRSVATFRAPPNERIVSPGVVRTPHPACHSTALDQPPRPRVSGVQPTRPTRHTPGHARSPCGVPAIAPSRSGAIDARAWPGCATRARTGVHDERLPARRGDQGTINSTSSVGHAVVPVSRPDDVALTITASARVQGEPRVSRRSRSPSLPTTRPGTANHYAN